MGSRDENSASFDPRTWDGAADPAASAPKYGNDPASAEASFDPRSWRGEAGSPQTTAPGASQQTPSAPQADIPIWRCVAAVAACGAILAAGGGIAYVHRGPSPSSRAPPVARDPPKPVAAAGAAANLSATGGRRTLVVADAGQVRATIAATGIAPGAARDAAQDVLAVVGVANGEIRLSYEVAGPPGAVRLLSLEATRGDGAGVRLTPAPEGGFKTTPIAAHLTTRIRSVTGQMDATNFYSSAVTAGVDDSLISDFAKAFSFDFNFQTEIHPGDVFGAAIEQPVNAAGQPVGLPRLVYVSMRTQTKSRALYSFTAPGESQPSWFDANGRSVARSLMRTPVDGARITSTFGARFHPILHFMKMHKGIDFAAPTGTPIYASGNGQIEWAAMKGANGNLTILRHDNGWQTYYLHQSVFMPGVVKGARVSQGQKIGEIGTTGRSTGPHLHYEVHINGEAVDPQGIDTGSGLTLQGAALAAFRSERERVDRARSAQP